MNMRSWVLLFVLATAIAMLHSGVAEAVGPGKVLAWPGGGRGQVTFEGSEHAKEGLGCKDCHSGLFSMKHGTAKITMAALNRGELCGACHNGRAAFSTSDPKECHECHKKGEKRSRHGHGEKKHDDHEDD